MSEEEINALPVHKYKVLDPEKWVNFLPVLSLFEHFCLIVIKSEKVWE